MQGIKTFFSKSCESLLADNSKKKKRSRAEKIARERKRLKIPKKFYSNETETLKVSDAPGSTKCKPFPCSQLFGAPIHGSTQ